MSLSPSANIYFDYRGGNSAELKEEQKVAKYAEANDIDFVIGDKGRVLWVPAGSLYAIMKDLVVMGISGKHVQIDQDQDDMDVEPDAVAAAQIKAAGFVLVP